MKNLHLVVEVIIVNKKKNLFYIQQKDETHPIPEFRLKYCFFGGGIEPTDKNDSEALRRELFEELEENFAEKIFKNSRKLKEVYITDVIGRDFKSSLYESVLTDKTIKGLSKSQIYEGKGVLVKKEDILKIPFLGDSQILFEKYLQEYLKQ